MGGPGSGRYPKGSGGAKTFSVNLQKMKANPVPKKLFKKGKKTKISDLSPSEYQKYLKHIQGWK